MNIGSDFDYMGIKLKMSAVVSVKDLIFKKDPKYHTFSPEILDEKIFKSTAPEKVKKASNPPADALKLNQLKQIAKELEKHDLDEKNTDYLSKDNSIEFDSMASKKDSVFWAIERQVPLTQIEIKGFKQADSIYIANFEKINKKVKKDSLARTTPNKFEFSNIFSGKNI